MARPPSSRDIATGRRSVAVDHEIDATIMEVVDAHDTEVVAPCGRERGFADRLVHAAPAQVADGANHPQRDMDGVPGVKERPLLVRRASPRALRRTTRTAPLAAARLEQHQLPRLGALLRAGGC